MIYSILDAIDGDESILHIHTHGHFDSLDLSDSTPGLADWPITEITNMNTYGGYMPLPDTATTAFADIVFDFGSTDAIVNCLSIAVHSLGTFGCTVGVYLDNDPAFPGSALFEIEPDDDSPIMAVFPDQQYRYCRIRITYGPDKFQIGVLKIGQALVMQHRIYGGHSPTTLCRVTASRPLMSETGQFIGRATIRHGFRGSYNWQHLEADWYREHFDPFVDLARFDAFFVAWRPVSYPHEVIYCQTPPSSDIHPTNMGRRDLMEVTVPVEAHDWEAVVAISGAPES